MFYSCKIVPQGDTDKNDKPSKYNGCKGHQKGQICNGTISQNKCHKEHILHGKFHAFFKKCTTFGLCCPTNTRHTQRVGICDTYNMAMYRYCDRVLCRDTVLHECKWLYRLNDESLM